MHVAFIGTGNMGLPMLANLLKKGFSATAYDIVPAALDRAVAQGATRAASPAESAASGEIVITILPSSGNVEAAYLGAGGIIDGVAKGRLCIDMSTIDPGTSQRVAARLAERGVRFIDTPVSGGSAAPPLEAWRSWSAARRAILPKPSPRSTRWAAISSMSARSAPAKSPNCATT